MQILIGRIYDPTPEGTLRVMVDRLWPRGVRKEDAPWDMWLKAVAPSNELRTWYHAHPEAMEEFHERYAAELQAPEAAAAMTELALLGEKSPVALLTARREVERSHASSLQRLLLRDEDASGIR